MNLFNQNSLDFPVNLSEINQRIERINPVKYGKTRNYLDGFVTYLSPYISRGVISTKTVFERVMSKNYDYPKIEKFIQELAWRDYWQQIGISKGETINSDLKRSQSSVSNYTIPKAIIEGTTGIEAFDKAIKKFYETGYMHNHMRMYIAGITCNVGQYHWKKPAQWLYYNLLDADWASNNLSWQWVAGTNSNKKYIANQENINKYCATSQTNTFLDIAYEDFDKLNVPNVLFPSEDLKLITPLPESDAFKLNPNIPTCIFNIYNLDPNWKKDIKTNNILLLEPSHFEEYPVSKKTINFILDLAKENIENIKIYIGDFDEFDKTYKPKTIFYKEHPLNKHYKGIESPREFMFNVTGYHSSFFSFWKKCKKQLLT